MLVIFGLCYLCVNWGGFDREMPHLGLSISIGTLCLRLMDVRNE